MYVSGWLSTLKTNVFSSAGLTRSEDFTNRYVGLALTAECEHAVIQASTARPGTARPTTARPSTAIPPTTPANIARYIPLLLEAIDKERTYVEDDFQAQVCLGWIHWELGEPSLAAARLPKDIEQEFSQLDGTNKESTEWTRVCALKASYIKGSSLRKNGAFSEAMETYESALPILTSVPSGQKQAKEMRTWTELFLTGFCMLSAHAIKSKTSPILETETLSAFRAWAKFWEAQGPAPVGGHAIQTDVSRRQVWKEYYVTISDLLQEGLPYPITPFTSAYAETSTKLQQRAELKRVEAKYETLLLSEVSFPRAEESSEEVEGFVDVVIQNWRILCGNSWKEQDLGEGGAEAVSRGVLDILYRAATKTFHSTAILRHLFTVHLAVAEFDLAFKAFDTYMDIVKKGKARIEKTGEEEVGLDDDEMVLQTASECVKALCRHGSRRGAEKANDLGQFFEEWLEKHHPIQPKTPNGGSIQEDDSAKAATAIQPQVFAKAWRCIGIGHAQWARLMFDAPLRAEFQLKAIKCFRKALLPQYESTTDVETLFALGTILAERRELPAAIEVVKSGLLPHSSTGNIPKAHAGYFTRERMLIPLWHLMALLLSARHEFMTAARSCEGAFEQFQDPKNLFGQEELNGAYRSTHLNEKATSRNQGVVDDMSDFEKESVLEVKMTQLSLIEVLEGPEIAVNASDELVSLYTRLFGNPRKTAPVQVPNTALVVPPKSSAGTIRSIRGSLFGRSVRSVRKLETESPIDEEPLPPAPRPQTTQTVASLPAPKIQVIQENGLAAKKSVSSKSRTQHHQEKLQKRSDSVRKTRLDGARSRSASSSSRNRVPNQSQEEQYFTPPVDAQDRAQWLESKTGSNSSQQLSHRERMPKSTQSEHTLLKPHRLTLSKNPVTRFPKDQERRRRIAILVNVWLLIGGFYCRASMFEDAKGAIEEAEQLVKGMEDELMKEINGNVSADHARWGGGKNVGELWGDVFAEVSNLPTAQATCYIDIILAWPPCYRPKGFIYCYGIFRVSANTLSRSSYRYSWSLQHSS